MVKKAVLLLCILISFYSFGFSNIPKLSEHSKISLLTCTPNSDAIYALFGHSGIRVQDDSLSLDIVFDYGVFSFSTDNFIFKFVKGETDYIVKTRPFEKFDGRDYPFVFEYSNREMGVTEQVFNIPQSDKQQVFEALITNAKPENRVYRYNFFYDNCATRLRDMIQNNIEGKIDYKPYSEEQTYRDLLDECLILTPWTRFGINIVIGSGADELITERQKDFLPLYVSTAFANANVVDDSGSTRTLVLENNELLQPAGTALELLDSKRVGYRAPNYPLYVGIILLIIGVIISCFWKKKNLGEIFDFLLFLSAGIAGCIIFFLMFFSEHPCVNANWNFVWLNPLAFIVVFFLFVKLLTKCVISYHFVNFVALSLFIVLIPFIPQTIEIAFTPYILTLWLRSGCNVLEYRREKVSSKN